MVDERLRAFYDIFESRKSIRHFADRPVEPEKIERLVISLGRAQSAANRQPWHFIILSDEEARGRIRDLFTKEGFKRAPVLVVACADPSQAWVRKSDNVNYAWVDVTIAITEMIGAATAEGLGTCWVAAIDAEAVKARLGIPEKIELVAVIPIGYPEEELKREAKTRKPISEIIHHGRW
jgi:nitroreductase